MKNIINKTFSKTILPFENEKMGQQWNQIPPHPDAAEEKICRQRHNFAMFDEICVEGKTYPLLHMFSINAPQTAYEKLLSFLH